MTGAAATVCAVAAAAVALAVTSAAAAAVAPVADDVHHRRDQPDGQNAENQPGSKVHRITPAVVESG